MRRVIEPLEQMGAHIVSASGCAPLQIDGAELHGIWYTLPVASAQVKSGVLLAGLFASGETVVMEPASLGRSRDHTETMLRALGAPVQVTNQSGNATGAPDGWCVSVTGAPLFPPSTSAYQAILHLPLSSWLVHVSRAGRLRSMTS